jgi:hypothetical protein
MQTFKQPTAAPTRKVNAALLGGAVATVFMAVFAIFLPAEFARLQQVPGFETAIGSLVSVALAYMVKERV